MSVRLEGFDKFTNTIRRMQNPSKANAIVLKSAKNWEGLAKRSAPKDQGKLINSITSELVKDGQAEVYVNAKHAPFVEWGTKKKFNPGEMASYASSIQYQKTGDYYDFLNAILDWVKRKGIGNTYNVSTRKKNRVSKDQFLAMAERIAFSIMRNGINPQPFFFIHKREIEEKLNRDLKELFN